VRRQDLQCLPVSEKRAKEFANEFVLTTLFVTN